MSQQVGHGPRDYSGARSRVGGILAIHSTKSEGGVRCRLFGHRWEYETVHRASMPDEHRQRLLASLLEYGMDKSHAEARVREMEMDWRGHDSYWVCSRCLLIAEGCEDVCLGCGALLSEPDIAEEEICPSCGLSV